MHKLAVLMVAILAACSSSDPMPDAPLPAVHDQLAGDPCDPAWATATASPFDCEYACEVKPIAQPCPGKTPCNDQPACAGAMAIRSAGTIDCPTTFIAHDYKGDHRGCCALRTTSSLPDRVIPTFYDCPK